MSNRFLKYVISESSEILEGDPNAFFLLLQIAKRANRGPEINSLGLGINQALISNKSVFGLSPKGYRRAKERLKKGNLASFQGRGNGTVATLLNSMVWDINGRPEGQAKGKRVGEVGRAPGRFRATNKNQEVEVRKEIKEVVEFLNSSCEKNFQCTTILTQQLINARLKKYSVDDLKRVIRVKSAQWKNSARMNAFLKPDTLFRESNFEAYMNEKEGIIDKSSTDTADLDRFIAQKRRELETAHG